MHNIYLQIMHIQQVAVWKILKIASLPNSWLVVICFSLPKMGATAKNVQSSTRQNTVISANVFLKNICKKLVKHFFELSKNFDNRWVVRYFRKRSKDMCVFPFPIEWRSTLCCSKERKNNFFQWKTSLINWWLFPSKKVSQLEPRKSKFCLNVLQNMLQTPFNFWSEICFNFIGCHTIQIMIW